MHGDRGLVDYLAVLPSIPETVPPEQVKDALSRFEIHDSKSGVSARVINVVSTDESGTSVIIDTDAFTLVDFDPDASELWETLEELRRMKNRIFFGSITEAAAKEFDK